MTETDQKPQPTAAMIAIGDELLSGRTRDANIHYLANWLTARGVDLVEVRIVADVEASIVGAVRALSAQVDYLFTSGGIGPTHDDITALAIGKAFGAHTDVRDDALAVLADWYAARGEEVTPARRRMARIPDGASLIANSVSGAPGFRIGNVFVMAGVPAIFNAMLEAIDKEIERGAGKSAWTVKADVRESEIAALLDEAQAQNPGLSIGSYPGKTGQGGSVSVVIRGFDGSAAERAAREIAAGLKQRQIEPQILEGMPGSE